MTPATFTHFVFVDFENVPTVDLSVLGDVPAVVTLFLGQKSKLKPPLVEQITKLPYEVRLIKVGLIKKNALDFVLTYHLGAAVARHPGARCHIISGDGDYEPIIKHLANNGVTVTKHATMGELPFLPASQKLGVAAKAAPPTKKQAEDRGAKIIARLVDPTRSNRPSTEKALRSRIKTDLGKEATDAKVEEIIGKLKQRGVTSEASGKVAYP